MEPSTPLPTTPAPPAAQTDSTAKIVYILYLVALVSGVTALVGVIMAYVNVGDAPEPLRTHYRFQIRTFWIGCLYALVAALATFAVVGAFLFLLVAVWYVVRCAKGLQYLGRGEPYPNAGTWLW
jgi:uncharacterized membrane protein